MNSLRKTIISFTFLTSTLTTLKAAPLSYSSLDLAALKHLVTQYAPGHETDRLTDPSSAVSRMLERISQYPILQINKNVQASEVLALVRVVTPSKNIIEQLRIIDSVQTRLENLRDLKRLFERASGQDKFKRFHESTFGSLAPSDRGIWIKERKIEANIDVISASSDLIYNFMSTFFNSPENLRLSTLTSFLNTQTGANEIPFQNELSRLAQIHQKLEELKDNYRLMNLSSTYDESQRNLDRLIEEGKVENGPWISDRRYQLGFGASKIIYSIPYNETKEITERVWRTTPFEELFGDPHLAKQDPEHNRFVNAYREWAKPVLQGLDEFAYAHPAAGSAEAIKDTLSVLHGNNPQARLHMFDGDYEGVVAYASAMNFQVIKHARTEAGIRDIAKQIKPGDVWYISEPSALDGNIWSGYDSFMKTTQDLDLKVLVDTAYVGTIARDYKIRVDYPHIAGVFFSLSKPFGVYYQRIGGVFVKSPNKLLQGNVWTKNLIGLRVGEALMKAHDVFDIARTYRWAQTAAIQEFNKLTGIGILPSDVITVGYLPQEKVKEVPKEFQNLFRGHCTHGFFRPCFVPSMISSIKGLCAEALTQMSKSPGETTP